MVAGVVVLCALMLPGCVRCESHAIQETYKYSVRSKNYVQPAAVDGWAERSALTTNTTDGKFFCFTNDKSQADDFINAQRTLIGFLRDSGVEIGKLEYQTGAQALNSFSRYLSDLHGERKVYDMMLFPDMTEETTGKSWEQLAVEWEQHIRDKYADVQLSDSTE